MTSAMETLSALIDTAPLWAGLGAAVVLIVLSRRSNRRGSRSSN